MGVIELFYHKTRIDRPFKFKVTSLFLFFYVSFLVNCLS